MALNWRGDFLRYRKYFLNIKEIYNQKQEIKMFLEIILSFLTIIMFSLFAVRPTLLTIGKLVTEIETKQKTIQDLNTKIANLQTAKRLYEANEDKFSLLDIAIPKDPTIETQVKQIVGISQKNNLTLTAMSIGEVNILGNQKQKKENKELSPLPANSDGFNISFSVVGSYSDLESFLKDSENLLRPLKLDKVNFGTAETKDGKRIILTIEARGIYER